MPDRCCHPPGARGDGGREITDFPTLSSLLIMTLVMAFYVLPGSLRMAVVILANTTIVKSEQVAAAIVVEVPAVIQMFISGNTAAF